MQRILTITWFVSFDLPCCSEDTYHNVVCFTYGCFVLDPETVLLPRRLSQPILGQFGTSALSETKVVANLMI